MLTPRPIAALFDWDGTLIDSAEVCFRIYRRLFGEFGIAFDHRRFEETYSPDWYQTYAMLGIPREHWGAANARWQELHALEPCPLLEGVEAALERLSAAGLRLGLVTSGTRMRIRSELDRHGVAAFFDVVICSEDVERKKPDPEGLLAALGRLGVSPDRAVYVGDSPEDIRMASAAGVRSIGIPGGFPNREALRAAAATRTVDTVREMVDVILGTA